MRSWRVFIVWILGQIFFSHNLGRYLFDPNAAGILAGISLTVQALAAFDPVAIVTPLGPLGLDWAYGFDRVDASGRPAPKWMLHFKLGQIF